MASLVQFKQPISTLITQSGTKVQKAISQRGYLPSNVTLLRAMEGTTAKLITFAPNSKSKFAQAGYDQVMLSYQKDASTGVKTKLLSLFKKGQWVKDLWMKPKGGFEQPVSAESAKKLGLLIK